MLCTTTFIHCNVCVIAVLPEGLNGRPCLVAAASGQRSIEALCLALEDRDYFAVSVKRGELIVGHIPRWLSKR